MEKVEIANNEFGLKYRLLREQSTQKFLVFKSGAQLADRDNWLLDVQLAHTDFRTDKASLWLTELELPYEFRPIVNCHEFFFNSAKRRDQLKDRVTKTDTTTQIRIKMLGVCADSDSRIDSVLENLLEELASDSTAKRYELITKCGLDPFLWEQVKKSYQYESNAASVNRCERRRGGFAAANNQRDLDRAIGARVLPNSSDHGKGPSKKAADRIVRWRR